MFNPVRILITIVGLQSQGIAVILILLTFLSCSIHLVALNREVFPKHRKDFFWSWRVFIKLQKDSPRLRKDFLRLHKDFLILYKDFSTLHKVLLRLHKDITTLHKDISTLHKVYLRLHKDFLMHSNLPGPDTTITNSGGKNGQFDIQALLKDSLNKIVLQKQYP